MFLIVCVTFIKQARCFQLFTSLLESQRSVLNCFFVTLIKRARCFDLFTSLVLSARGVLNCLRHFYKASKVFWIVYVTFRESEKYF